MQVSSATEANADTFSAHQAPLEELAGAFPLQPGQCGAILSLGDRHSLDAVRLRADGVIGSGLELDGELLQLSAFTSDSGTENAFGRIARPSRRR